MDRLEADPYRKVATRVVARRAGVPRVRALTAAVLAAATLAGGCAKSPTQPTSFALSGRVRLVGYAVDLYSRPQGTRIFEDATGVPVQLMQGSRVVARTTTVAGAYRFSRVPAGSYFTRSTAFGPVTDDARDVTLAAGDVTLADTLVLASTGDLVPVPNPIGTGTSVYFAVAETTHVRVRVLDLGGTLVRDLMDNTYAPGLYSVDWAGINTVGAQAPGDVFWVTFDSPADQRAHLVFR